MPAVLQIKPERISVWKKQDGAGFMLDSDCLRQHHAGNSMLYREHNKHSKVKGLIPSHTLKSFFCISSAIQLVSAGWSHNTAAWLEILAVEVGQAPLSYGSLILIGLGTCISQLLGGKLKCTYTKDYIDATHACVYVNVSTCVWERQSERETEASNSEKKVPVGIWLQRWWR